MSTALETHLGGRKSGRDRQERKPDPLSPKIVGAYHHPEPNPGNSPFGLGVHRNDHLLSTPERKLVALASSCLLM
jgi:hypothetical protein